MADTTIIEREVTAVPADVALTPFSRSAAIAGALAATAVALIIIALGSGIGLSFASPYSGPSATSLTIAAAVWLVMAQTIGFATGGYLAGRLRSPMSDLSGGETAFRDAAEGLVVWAIGVVAMATLVAAMGLFAASATTQVAAGAAAGTAATWVVALARRPQARPSTSSICCSGPRLERLRQARRRRVKAIPRPWALPPQERAPRSIPIPAPW